MARRCSCARLLAAVQEDPRLRTLPLAARMLFLLVAEAALRAPVPGLLPFAQPVRVSLLVSAPVTEVETHLETLLAEGLLAPDPGGGLAVPLLIEAATRSDVARKNGAKGGRPRRGETPEAYLQRKQGEMMLLLPGGRAEAGAETQETQPAKPGANPVLLTNTSSIEVSSKSGASTDDRFPHVALGTEIAAMIGMDGSRGGYDFRPVQAWLTAGATPAQIRAAIGKAIARPKFDPGAIRSLAYFDKPVAAERASAPAPRRDTPEDAAQFAAIEARIAAVLRGGSAAAA